MIREYNFKNIRKLLTEGFDEKELRNLCFDVPVFRPIYADLPQNVGKAEIINIILEYSDNKVKIEPLLEWAKEHNPTKFGQYKYDSIVRIEEEGAIKETKPNGKPPETIPGPVFNKIMLGILGIVTLCVLGVFVCIAFQLLNSFSPVSSTTPVATESGLNPIPTNPPSNEPIPTNVVNPTETPLPTDTPTPTETPLPTDTPTPESTALLVGQVWSQQGLSAIVTNFELKDFKCGSWRAWGEWILTIQNSTGQDLVINLTTEDFVLIDNEGDLTELYVSPLPNQYCDVSGPNGNYLPPGRVDIMSINEGASVQVRVYGVGAIENREWYEFRVKDAGRIQDAKWRIDIPR